MPMLFSSGLGIVTTVSLDIFVAADLEEVARNGVGSVENKDIYLIF